MKKLLLTLAVLSLCAAAFAVPYKVIPYPNRIVPGDGTLKIVSGVIIDLPKAFASELDVVAGTFRERFSLDCKQGAGGQIKVTAVSDLPPEGYRLAVDPKGVAIQASAGAGVFYAFQTLFQLMELHGDGYYTVPALSIEDAPAFGWRQYMLDDSRHFRGIEAVKKTLDEMARLKMNVFHWHVIDDNGWRIQIDKYPELTSIGAWRDSTEVVDPVSGKTWYNNNFDPHPHGGFYTKAQVRDIVAYAAQRHITIVPEIEVPAHTQAILAAYPWMSATDEKFRVRCTMGRTVASVNIADPKVEQFYKDVLVEMMELFPGKVIHIGGDELGHDVWDRSPAIQALIKEKGFTSYMDAQIWFTNKLAAFAEKNGRRIMGWNELLGVAFHDYQKKETNTQEVAPGTVIHYWQGEADLLREGLSRGYDVINTDFTVAYLDYKDVTLEKCYAFYPVPDGVTPEQAKRVLGPGCQMWGEWSPTWADIEDLTYPRIAAFAETGWTKKENKDYPRFLKALEPIRRDWDRLGVGYGRRYFE